MDKWDKRFIELAELVASWSSCYQENRQVGAVIVKDKRIMTTGYNGAPSGIESCKTKGKCLRRELDVPSGTKLELCYAVHAEQNAIAQAAKLGISVEGGTLYCTHQPCVICCKMIINHLAKEFFLYETLDFDSWSYGCWKNHGLPTQVNFLQP